MLITKSKTKKKTVHVSGLQTAKPQDPQSTINADSLLGSLIKLESSNPGISFYYVKTLGKQGDAVM